MYAACADLKPPRDTYIHTKIHVQVKIYSTHGNMRTFVYIHRNGRRVFYIQKKQPEPVRIHMQLNTHATEYTCAHIHVYNNTANL